MAFLSEHGKSGNGLYLWCASLIFSLLVADSVARSSSHGQPCSYHSHAQQVCLRLWDCISQLVCLNPTVLTLTHPSFCCSWWLLYLLGLIASGSGSLGLFKDGVGLITLVVHLMGACSCGIQAFARQTPLFLAINGCCWKANPEFEVGPCNSVLDVQLASCWNEFIPLQM